MKILVYGINYSPELTGIGKYTGEMVEWMARPGTLTCGSLPHRRTARNGKWASAAQLALSPPKRRCDRLALPAVRAETALDAENVLTHLGSFAPSSFFR